VRRSGDEEERMRARRAAPAGVVALTAGALSLVGLAAPAAADMLASSQDFLVTMPASGGQQVTCTIRAESTFDTDTDGATAATSTFGNDARCRDSIVGVSAQWTDTSGQDTSAAAGGRTEVFFEVARVGGDYVVQHEASFPWCTASDPAVCHHNFTSAPK
jgi:hypothetical protein